MTQNNGKIMKQHTMPYLYPIKGFTPLFHSCLICKILVIHFFTLLIVAKRKKCLRKAALAALALPYAQCL
jgi:hypothetical protein